MVGLLLQYNCDLNRKNKKNETGLELCSNNPRLKDFVQPKLPPAPKIQVQHVQQMESSPMNNANDVVNAIEQFRQVMNKNANLDDPNEVFLESWNEIIFFLKGRGRYSTTAATREYTGSDRRHTETPK